MKLVVARRRLDPQTVVRLADGRVMLGKEAEKEKLIDATGYLGDAIQAVQSLAQTRLNISIPSVKMVRYGIKRPRPLLTRLLPLGSSKNPLEDIAELFTSPPQISYLWR